MEKLKKLHRQTINNGVKKECNKKVSVTNNKSDENKDSLDISKLLELKGIDNILFLEKQIKIE